VTRATLARVRWATILAPLALTTALAWSLPSAAKPKRPTVPAWCAPEIETLSTNVCHFAAEGESHRTLVIFLHGLVPRYAPWQWIQQRAVVRMAKTLQFDVLFPQALPAGPHGAGGYAWPATFSEENRALVDGWAASRAQLEARSGHRYDEVFVVGFSSGAYYAASVALQGRFAADGYVLLAGGNPTRALPDAVRAPVYIGVSGRDRHTAPNARELGRALTKIDWPHKTDEQRVGHMISDVHMTHGLAYLRGASDKRIAGTN